MAEWECVCTDDAVRVCPVEERDEARAEAAKAIDARDEAEMRYAEAAVERDEARADCGRFAGINERLIKTAMSDSVEGAVLNIKRMRRELEGARAALEKFRGAR